MLKFIQIMGAAALIGLAAFCTFGFLAAAEVPDAVWYYRLLYGTIGLVSLTSATCLLVGPRRSRQ